jgi:hypothetical protein
MAPFNHGVESTSMQLSGFTNFYVVQLFAFIFLVG